MVVEMLVPDNYIRYRSLQRYAVVGMAAFSHKQQFLWHKEALLLVDD